MTVHHHMGTAIESADDIDRLMDGTRDTSGFCSTPATSHLPAAIRFRRPASISRASITSIARTFAATHSTACKRRDVSFSQAVVSGIFTVPGDGIVDYARSSRSSPRVDIRAGSCRKPSRIRALPIPRSSPNWAMPICANSAPMPASRSRSDRDGAEVLRHRTDRQRLHRPLSCLRLSPDAHRISGCRRDPASRNRERYHDRACRARCRAIRLCAFDHRLEETRRRPQGRHCRHLRAEPAS